MKKTLIFLLLFTINNFASLAQTFPIVITNTSFGGSTTSLNIQPSAAPSGSPITTLAINKRLVAFAVIPGTSVTGTGGQPTNQWYIVELPGTGSSAPAFGYVAAGSTFTNPICNTNYVSITASAIFIRPFAGATTTNVTIGGTNAKVFLGQNFAVTGSTVVGGVTWYQIDLPNSCSQTTGWISSFSGGSLLNFHSTGSIGLPTPTSLSPTSVDLFTELLTYSMNYYPTGTSFSFYNSGILFAFDNNSDLNTKDTVPLTVCTSYSVNTIASYGGCSSNPLSAGSFSTPCCVPAGISAHPSNASVTEPESAAFSISGVGSGSVSYQWQLSTDGGFSWSPISTGGIYTSSLNILFISSTTHAMNGYKYRCTITNSCGSATSSAGTLSVSCANVNMVSDPVNQTVCSGSNATFSVSVLGTPPFTYSLYKNGIFVTSTAGSSLATNVYTTPPLSPSDNGSYYYWVISNCANTIISGSAYVTVTSPAGAGIITGNSAICIDATSPLSDAAGGGVWSSETPGIANVSTSGVVTGVSTGTSTISYAVSSSCGTTVATKVVTVNALPTIDAGSNTAICAGSSTTLTASGGVSYSWSPSDGLSATTGVSVTASPTVTTTYTVIGTNSNDCQNSAVVTVSVNALPTIGVSDGSYICSGSSATLTATGGSTYIWTPATGLSATTGSSITANLVSTTTYTVVGTSSSGCGNSASTTVTVNPLPEPGEVTGASAFCMGTTIPLSNTTGGGSWSSSNTAVGTVSASGVVAGVAQGTATISYTVTNSCGSAVATAIVTVDNAFTSGKMVFCSPEVSNPVSNIWVMGTDGSDKHTLFSDAYYRQSLTASRDGTKLAYTKRLNPTGCSEGDSLWICTSNADGTNEQAYYLLPTYSTTEIRHLYFNSDKTKLIFNTFRCDVRDGDIYELNLATSAITQLTTNTDFPKFFPQFSPDDSKIIYTELGTGWYAFPCPGKIMNSDGSGIVTFDPLGGGNYHHIRYAPNASKLVFTQFPSLGSPYNLYTSNPDGTGVTSLSFTSSAEMQPVFNPESNAIVILDGSNDLKVLDLSGSLLETISKSGNTTFNNVNWIQSSFVSIDGVAVICAGSTTALTAAVAAGTWSSSNTAIGTVSATGMVTGISPGTTTISYTVTNSCGTAIVTHAITVNPLPDAGVITGPSSVTAWSAITLVSSAVSGGIWSVDNAHATVSTDGAVTGVSAGTVTVSYTITNGGCSATAIKVMTVNPPPSIGPISGPSSLCSGISASFTNALAGGTWSSSNTSIATVNTATGSLVGIAPGTVVISYIIADSFATKTITINAVPASITGDATVCSGATTTLSSSPADGMWSSSNAARATVNSISGLVTGVSTGTVNISYTLSSGCFAKIIVTVNPSLSPIGGSSSVCVDATIALTETIPGGTWNSSNTEIATVGASGIVTGVAAGTTIISYARCSALKTKVITVNALPSVPPITAGSGTVCAGSSLALTESTTGGTHLWSSSNLSVATVNSSLGTVVGISGGTAIISYKYTLGCSNYAMTTVTVNPTTIASVTGTTVVCAGSVTSLTGIPMDGAWSSSTPAKATIGSASGIVTGIAAGTTKISYTYTNEYGCINIATVNVTVNALPTVSGIVGSGSWCTGTSVTFTDPTTGGIWSSGNPSVASIGSSSGVVTGSSAGIATITYAFTGVNGCTGIRTKQVTVNAITTVSDITGPSTVVAGSSISLSNATPGGTWSSSNTSKATVSAGGVVTGVSAGAANITYTVTGCGTANAIQPITITASRFAVNGLNTVKDRISIFPNPTAGSFTLQSPENGKLIICDLDGKLIAQFDTHTGNTLLNLPGNIASGVYLCKYIGDSGDTEIIRLTYIY